MSSSPLLAAPLLFAMCVCYSGCRQARHSVSNSPAMYGVPKQHFQYCELEAIQQQVDPGGGLAALTSVMRYWDAEVSEADLAEKSPLDEGEDIYSIRKLRRIAIDEGMMAFALTMRVEPLSQLSEELENGRPVIVQLLLSSDGYPGLEPTAPDRDEMRHAVVFGQSDQEYLIMDTGHGVVRMPKTDFEKLWSGGGYQALVCSAF